MRTTAFGTRLLVEDSKSLVTPLSGQTFIKALVERVANTKYSIDIIQYQWNFYPGKAESPVQKLNRTVIDKAKGGTKMRVLLAKEGRDQHLTTINMRAKKYLEEAGVKVKFGRTIPIVHSKSWMIDDDMVLLGSHNLSNRSVSVNVETSVLIKSRAVTREFKRYFGAIWDTL